MPISKINQASAFEHNIKAKIYKNVHKSSKKIGLIRLTGLGLGVISGLLTISKRVGRIAEEILKGLINIVGSLFCIESCSFSRGVGMLFQACYEITIRLPFSVISAIVGIFAKTIMMLVDPTYYSHKLWMRHDPVERNRSKQAQAQAQAQLNQMNFQNAEAAFNQNPDDLNNIKFIAKCHLNGIGTPVNQAQAILYYNLAAINLHDIDSMKILADIAIQNNSYLEWLTFFDLAAKHGDTNANYQIGMMYLSLGNKEKASPYINSACENGSSIAKLARSIYLGGVSPNLSIEEHSNLNVQILKDYTDLREIGDNLINQINSKN